MNWLLFLQQLNIWLDEGMNQAACTLTLNRNFLLIPHGVRVMLGYSNVDQSEVIFGNLLLEPWFLLLSFGVKVEGDDPYGDVHSRYSVNAGYIHCSGQVLPIFAF